MRTFREHVSYATTNPDDNSCDATFHGRARPGSQRKSLATHALATLLTRKPPRPICMPATPPLEDGRPPVAGVDSPHGEDRHSQYTTKKKQQRRVTLGA